MNNFVALHKKDFDFREFVSNALKEDAGDGDHTSLAIIPAQKTGTLRLLVKEEGILAGVEAAKKIFEYVDKDLKIRIMIKDGSRVKKGDVAFVITGRIRSLLLSERLVLNVMQRMSGIATKAAMLQKMCKGTKAKVIDTRKTTPGFRFFEKWAVVIGGGANHRYGLYDMILIKDNHIDFAGGITEAIDAANDYLEKVRKKLKIEIETRNIRDVKKVVAHGRISRIMLDNYTPAETQKAVDLIRGKYETESSGGITEKNISKYAAAGVDFISIGALTHHVKSLDLSLKAV
jgi:nicotinate-nucleotide pyrophosphorylase (carboxylating)